MDISLGAFSFWGEISAGRMNVFGYLETVKHRYGLETVDLWNGLYEERSEYVWTPANDEVLHDIRAALEERRLRLSNIAIDRAHVWEPDEQVRAALKSNALRQIRAAHLLKAKTIRIDACYRNTETMTEDAFAYTVDTFREYAELAASCGMRVGPENHMGQSTDARWMKRLAEAVDHPAFGILLHLGRWKEGSGGDGDVAAHAYHIHVDIRTLNERSLPEKAHLLLADGYAGDWAVEYNPSANPYDEIGWALADVQKTVLAEKGNLAKTNS
ncbi:hypothetical protein GCM10020370_31010 [Paenibacillus hodogayensis]